MCMVNVEEAEKGTVHFDIGGHHLLRYLATPKDTSTFNIDGTGDFSTLSIQWKINRRQKARYDYLSYVSANLQGVLRKNYRQFFS